jgi:transposase
LIKAVEEEGLTIKEAAQNLKINYSTAKHIVKVFKRTGEISTQLIINKRQPERDIANLEALTYSALRGGYISQSGLSAPISAQENIFRPQQIN